MKTGVTGAGDYTDHSLRLLVVHELLGCDLDRPAALPVMWNRILKGIETGRPAGTAAGEI